MAAPQTDVTPLHGVDAVVHGNSPVAETCARHLRLLGASVQVAPTADETVAAEVLLQGTASEEPLTCVVTWAADANDTRVRDEVSAQAVCGVMHLHGRRWGRPVAIQANYCGTVAATVAMQGLLAALLARARGTQIREVRTSVVHTTLLAIAHYVAVATADDGGPFDLSPGGPPLRSADEVVFQPEFTTGGAWAAFWQELNAEPRAADLGWRVWSPFALTATIPLPEELFGCAKQHPFAEIQRAAAVSGATVQPLRSLADRARELGLHTGAPVPAPWTLTRSRGLTDTPGQPSTSTAPTVRAPLYGVTLVEATRRILGPLSGRALAMLGADVVHIEPPGGDPFRDFPPLVDDCSAVVRCMTVGKRVVELDLKAQADRPALHALLDEADIFLQNWAPGKAAALGLTPADLHARNPHLLYAIASGWHGEMGSSPPAGTDWIVQAHTGVGEAVAPDNPSPTVSLMTVLDSLGGLLNAEAILAGLVARERAKLGYVVESSLLSAATVLTARELERVAAREPVSHSTHDASPSVITSDLRHLADDPHLAGCLTRDGYLGVTPPLRFR